GSRTRQPRCRMRGTRSLPRPRRSRRRCSRRRRGSRVGLVEGDRRVVDRRVGDGRPLDGLREQHVLRVDLVVAVVLGDLEVVAERDRVERARELAVAAEDAAAHVDLVDARVALAGGDAVVGRVLGSDDADAVRRARGGAQRAADALLQAVLVLVQPVAPAEARVDRALLLRVLLGERALEDLLEGDAEALQRRDRLRAHVAATTSAVTTAFTVATGSRTFHPKRINWS